MSFEVGDRVKVLRDPEFGPGPWPDEPIGTVTAQPETVEGSLGPMLTYWIQFDEPQYDTDGDGPYARSQVLERYLISIP